MITLLEGYPDDLLALSASGHVSAEDYRTVLIPEANKRLERHKTLWFLYCIGPRFDGFASGAMLADAGIGLQNPGHLGRTALVTEGTWIADAARLFAPFFHMPFRVFSDEEFETAHAWVLESAA